MSDPASADFLAFQEAVLGRYSIDREIGRGGMGVVYLAHEVALDRPVALKVMPPALAAQPALRERFLREARTAAKLSHPNIVPIHAVVEAGDFVFFAMAYIDGQTLGERVRERGPVPSKHAVKILQEVSWALAYAHAEGVVHRDVKPDNILLEEASGRALVTDFGIAQLRDDAGPTSAGEILGTAEFMSPEQAEGAAVGSASDLYSLGVVGYYAVAGRLPFEGSSVAAVLAKHLTQQPAPLASVAPEVSAPLAAAIDRCLAKAPEDRFSDARALAEAVAAGTAVQVDLPIPLRVFVRSVRELATSVPLILVLWLFILIASLGANVAEWPLPVLLLLGTMAVGPLAILARDARRLLSAGYTLEEGRLAVIEDGERRLEEVRFEFGKGLTRLDRALRGMSVAGLFTVPAAVAAAVGGIMSVDAAGLLAVAGANVGIFAGFAAAFRNKRARDWVSDIARWLVNGRVGHWVLGLGSIGLRRKALAGGAHRPTEMAISIAADRLFDELPRELKRDLSTLPGTIERLEADARTIRRQIEQLDTVLAQIGDGPGHDRVDEERTELRASVERTRTEAQGRLTQAISTLEKIRLGLLRLHAGDGTVESLTMELGTAAELSGMIDRLLEGQREVARLLRPPSLRTDP